MLIGLLFGFWGYRTVKQIKASGQIPPSSASQKQKKFWMMLAVYGATCASMFFLMPYLGIRLLSLTRAVVCAFSFFICVVIALVTLKSKRSEEA